MIRILLFVIGLAAATTTALADPVRIEERGLVQCGLEWSADGSRVTENYAEDAVQCDNRTNPVFTFKADFEFKMSCVGHDCTHWDNMNEDQRKHYTELDGSRLQANIYRLPHVICVSRSADNKLVSVGTAYVTEYTGKCEAKYILRTYYKEDMRACMTEGGCIPLQYVSGPGNEYSEMIKLYPAEESYSKLKRVNAYGRVATKTAADIAMDKKVAAMKSLDTTMHSGTLVKITRPTDQYRPKVKTRTAKQKSQQRKVAGTRVTSKKVVESQSAGFFGLFD